nr:MULTISPECIES: 5'-nucleotidase C-terminal domain-containing protein [Myxococcaceae]
MLLTPLCGCAPATRAPALPPAPVRLTLVGTNDLHGWVMPHEGKLPDGTPVTQGGLATFAGYVAALRQDNPDGVLLLDGGDLFQGTLASNLTEGEVVVRAMNQLGYVAAALGNHEFDFGPVGARSVAQAGDDPVGALKARIAEAHFAVLAANVQEAATGAAPAWLKGDGTLLVERNGVRIGVLGLATPTTPSVTNPVNVAGLRFSPMAPAALAAAQRLRARGAEVVVAVAHAGAVCKRLDDPHDTSSCDRGDSEIFELLEALPAGTLDAVIAGHTHQPVGHFVNGTPVIETSGQGRAFGLVELELDPKTHRVLPERTRLQAALPVCERVEARLGTCDERALKEAGAGAQLVPARFRGHPVQADPAMGALLGEALARVQQEQQRPLGVRVPAPLKRAYEAESDLGNVLTDALRAVAGVDVALLNSGGLRADLPAGELRYGDVFEVLPFDNTLATLTLSPAELRQLLDAAYGHKGGILQVSGLRVTLAGCAGQAHVEAVTREDGRPLPASARLRVAMPDFLARGGSGLDAVTRALPPGSIDLGEQRPLTVRDALVEYWKAQGQPLVAPPRGRITRLPAPREGCSP